MGSDNPDGLTDPEQHAKRLREHAEGDGPGVLHDTLSDSHGRVRGTARRLHDMYVELDAVADNRGLLPNDVQQDVREMQEQVGVLARWADALADNIAEERHNATSPSDQG